ncbi:unnamed protein product [Caenorhabditis angaria]|uniref:Tetratricopeptide repeat protein n=1 Tax=Caenorhabditis angaria TaxID=860376 RepID=A0A9P1MUD9_9PELO|nr:unnamed protein product [Caenorhabditis angaria]
MYGLLLRLFLIGVVYSSTDLELGNAFLAKGQLSDALSHFHEAINSNPKNYQAIYRRALIYLALSRPSSAFADFQKVLALKPDFVKFDENSNFLDRDKHSRVIQNKTPVSRLFCKNLEFKQLPHT